MIETVYICAILRSFKKKKKELNHKYRQLPQI